MVSALISKNSSSSLGLTTCSSPPYVSDGFSFHTAVSFGYVQSATHLDFLFIALWKEERLAIPSWFDMDFLKRYRYMQDLFGSLLLVCCNLLCLRPWRLSIQDMTFGAWIVYGHTCFTTHCTESVIPIASKFNLVIFAVILIFSSHECSLFLEFDKSFVQRRPGGWPKLWPRPVSFGFQGEILKLSNPCSIEHFDES